MTTHYFAAKRRKVSGVERGMRELLLQDPQLHAEATPHLRTPHWRPRLVIDATLGQTGG